MGRKDEKLLAEQVADWMRAQYPNVPYRFDLAADIRVTDYATLKYNKRLHPYKGFLDLTIISPAGEYHGAHIELKADGKSPYRKDGVTLLKSQHLEEQAAWMEWLTSLGYYAAFATGFDQAQSAIKTYLARRTPDQIIKSTPKVIDLHLRTLIA